MRDIKRIISVLLTVCIIVSAAGCNAQQNVDVRPLCESFFNDVKEGNPSKLMSYFDSSDTTIEDLSSVIRPSGLNEAQYAYLDAIKKTTAFTVQDPVFDTEYKTATVFVTFYQADYSAPEVVSAKDFASLESEKTDIMPGTLKDFFVKGEFVLAPERIYTNASELGIRVTFNNDLFGYRFVPGIRYSVSRGDKVLYTSDVLTVDGEVMRLDLKKEMTDDTSYGDNGFLLEGVYTFAVTDDKGNELVTMNCRVQNKTYEKETLSFQNLKKDHYLSNLVFDFKDEDKKTNVIIYKSGWWDYDSTSVGKSAFGSNTKTLGFSLAVNKDMTDELFYDYYYSKDPDFKGVNEAQPVYSSSCRPTVYDDQACYDLDYASEKFDPGFYGIAVYSDASKTHMIMTAACIVVKESSADIKGN